MPRLELTSSDAKELRRVLESHLSDLRIEIAGADDPAFRQGLKRTETLLKHVIGQLHNRARAIPRARKRR